MNLAEFIRNGVVIPNPEHNNTKAGRLQPETIVSYDINHINTSIDDINARINRNYSDLSHYGDPTKYSDYNVIINSINTAEELNRERAKNQSNWEQWGHSIAQIVENEIGIGTAIGFLSLYDVAKAAVDEDLKVGQYANPWTQYLEEVQEKNRERLAIYRENPGEHFDFSDFNGWFTENFVNIGSTLSLLVPSVGVAKLLGLVGKLATMGASRVPRIFGKTVRGIQWTDNATFRTLASINSKISKTKGIEGTIRAGHAARKLENVAGYAVPAVFSRTMENYQEGREVYKNSYQTILGKLNEMDDESFENIKKSNNLNANFNREQTASTIAGVGAQDTFLNDYWMLFMDLLQMRGIAKAWQKVPDSFVSAATRRTFENQIRSLTKEGAEAVIKENAKRSIVNNIWDELKYGLKPTNWGHTWSTLSLSEGIEEGFQGIMSAEGEELANKMVDPFYTDRTLRDYLADPQIWEQAFWGVLSGFIFGEAAKGLDYGKRKIVNKYNSKKGNYSEDQLNRASMGIEESRQANIKEWGDTFEKLYNDFAILNKGYDPDAQRFDKDGNPVLDNGNPVYKPITSEDAETRKKQLIDNALLNMYSSAIHVGNSDLLQEFMNNEEVRKALHDNGVLIGDDARTDKYITDRFNTISGSYDAALYNIYGSVDVQNDFAARIYAKNIARDYINENFINGEISDINARVAKMVSDAKLDATEVTKAEQFYRGGAVLERLHELEQDEDYLDTLYKSEDSRISEAAFKARKKEINKEREELIKDYYQDIITSNLFDKKNDGILIAQTLLKEDIVGKIINDSNAYYKFVDDFEKSLKLIFGESNISLPNTITDELRNKIKLEVLNSSIRSRKPNSNKDYEEGYKDFARTLDKHVAEEFSKAYNALESYLKESKDKDDLNNRIQTFLKNPNTISSDMERYSKMLKIGGYIQGYDDIYKIMSKHPHTIEDQLMFDALVNSIEKNIENKEKAQTTVTVNGNPVNNSTTQPNTATNTATNQSTTKPTNPTNTNPDETTAPPPTPKGRVNDEDDVPSFTGEEELAEQTLDDSSTLNIKDDEESKTNAEFELQSQFVSGVDLALQQAQHAQNAWKSAAFTYIKDILNSIRKDVIKKAIESGSVNSVEFQALHKEITDWLVANYSGEQQRDIASRAAYMAMQNMLTMFSLREDTAFKQFKRNALLLANGISVKINNDNIQMSDTTEFTNEELKALFKSIIENYFEIRGYNKNTENNKVIVDLMDFIDALLEKSEDNPASDMSYSEVANLLYNIKDLISENEDYQFVNIEAFEKTSNIQEYLKQLFVAKTREESIANYMRVNGALLDKNGSNNSSKVIDLLKSGKKIQAKQRVRTYNVGDETREEKQGIELFVTDNNGNEISVGFLNNVEFDLTNNIISSKRQVFKHVVITNSGFLFDIDANGNDVELDKFFEEIANAIDDPENHKDGKEILDLLNYLHSKKEHPYLDNSIDGQTKASGLFKNKIVHQLLHGTKFGKFGFGKVKADTTYVLNEVERANMLLNAISDIIYFRGNRGMNTAQTMRSYREYINRVRRNYLQTNELQNAIEQGKTINIEFKGFERETFTYNDGETHSLSEYQSAKHGFNPKKNKVVIVKRIDNIDYLVVDGEFIGRPNLIDGQEGSMGIVIGQVEDAPLVSWFTGGTKLNDKDSNSINKERERLYNAVKNELNKIVSEFGNGTITFEQLQQSLSALLGGINGVRTNVFAGASVVNVGTERSMIYLGNEKNKNGTNEPDIIFMTKKPGTDEIKPGFSIKSKNGRKYISNFRQDNINLLTDYILKSLTFNMTYYMFNQSGVRTDETENNNQYYRKENNKFVIKVGGEEFKFDSFTDFAYKMDAFELELDLDLDENNDLVLNTVDEVSNNRTPPIVINVVNSVSPVEGSGISNATAIDELYDKRDENDGNISAAELIKAYNKSMSNVSEIVDILLGNNAFGIPLIDELIKYDDTDKKGHAYSKNGKTYITKKGRELLMKEPRDIIRLLVHERLHNEISKLKPSDRSRMMRELADTHRAALEALKNDTSVEAKSISNWIKNNGFENVDDYNSKHGSKISEEQFMEEWLVETLTRPQLISYLSNTNYIVDGQIVESKIEEDDNKKSIFQKIVDILAKLFDKLFGTNLRISNKSSIFAKEYEIIGMQFNTKPKTEKKSSKATLNTEKFRKQAKKDEKKQKTTKKKNNVDSQTTIEFDKPQTTEEAKEQNDEIVNEPINQTIDSMLEDIEDSTDNTEMNVDEEFKMSDTVSDDFESTNPQINENIIGDTNLNGTISVGNMEQFIAMFPTQIQPAARACVANGDIKFLC